MSLQMFYSDIEQILQNQVKWNCLTITFLRNSWLSNHFYLIFADLLLPEDSDQLPPRDRFNAVYLVFYLLGMGTLLPWNFFISVNSFWDYKFRDVNATTYHISDEGYGDDGKERTKLQGWPSKIKIVSWQPILKVGN